jgi:hypothetical protein
MMDMVWFHLKIPAREIMSANTVKKNYYFLIGKLIHSLFLHFRNIFPTKTGSIPYPSSASSYQNYSFSRASACLRVRLKAHPATTTGLPVVYPSCGRWGACPSLKAPGTLEQAPSF